MNRIRAWLRYHALRPTPALVRLSADRGFNLQYLVYWEATQGTVQVHLSEGSFLPVSGAEGDALLRFLQARSEDLRGWDRRYPRNGDGSH